MIFRRLLFPVLLIFIFTAGLSFPMGKKINMIPMKPGKLKIRDGEFLKYEYFENGEKIKDVFLLSKVGYDETNGNTVSIYSCDLYLDTKNGRNVTTLPKNYMDYNEKMVVSLEKASLIEHTEDLFTNMFLTHQSGIIYNGRKADYYGNIFNIETRLWDGYSTKTLKGRVKFKPDFPIWDSVSLAAVALRFMDLKSPGIVYVVEPNILKEPIPVFFRLIKNETLKTRAGIFNTIKIGLNFADPFIAKLSKTYLDSTFFWIEESERQLIVKIEFAGTVTELKSISDYGK